MKKLLALGLMALSMTGCQALSDAGGVLVDTIKAPPEAVKTAFSQIVDFLFNSIVLALSHLVAPLMNAFGL